MLALGNDVVDLLERPRNGIIYFQRLLTYTITNSEHLLLESLSGIELELRSRLVWAIKESAYKSSNKIGNLDRFNPKMFVIASLSIEGNGVHGVVSYKESTLTFEGLIFETFLHVWTSLSKNGVKVSHALSGKDRRGQSKDVRQLALDSTGIEEAFIEKDENKIPWIKRPSMDKIEVSLSHHGRLVACAHQI